MKIDSAKQSELKNSASEDENNGTEESETADDEYLCHFTKLQSYMYEPFVSKEWSETVQEKNHQIQKKALARLEILSGVLVINTNQ